MTPLVTGQTNYQPKQLVDGAARINLSCCGLPQKRLDGFFLLEYPRGLGWIFAVGGIKAELSRRDELDRAGLYLKEGRQESHVLAVQVDAHLFR